MDYNTVRSDNRNPLLCHNSNPGNETGFGTMPSTTVLSGSLSLPLPMRYICILLHFPISLLRSSSSFPVRKTGREILFAACFLYQRQNACLSFERSKYVYILPATCYAPAVKHSRCGTTAFVKSLPKPSPKQYAY